MRIVHLVFWILFICLSVVMPSSLRADDLMDIYQLALKNDPDLAAKEAAYQATDKTINQAWASLLPDVNVTGYSKDNRQKILIGGTGVTYFNTHGYEFSLRQPLVRLDRWVGLVQANANTKQAKHEFNQQQQQLQIDVAERFFNVLSTQNTLSFTQKEKASIAKELEQAKSRFELGAIAITDVLEAQARYDQSIAAEVEADNQVEIAKEQLKQLTGQYPETLSTLTNKLTLRQPEKTDQEWIDSALQQNLAIRSVEQAARSAKWEIQRQRTGHLPNIDAVGSASYTVAGGRFGGFKSKDEAVGFEASMNLFQSGNIWAKTKEARYRYVEASMQLESKRRQVVRETREAFLQIRALIARINALEQAVKSGQKALEAIEAGYNIGSRTIVDLLNAQTLLHRNQRDVMQAKYDYVLYHLRLRKAGGTLSVADLQEFNAYLG